MVIVMPGLIFDYERNEMKSSSNLIVMSWIITFFTFYG